MADAKLRTIRLVRNNFRIFKRCFDILFALCAFLLFFPFSIMLAITIKISSPGRVFYFSDRVGKNGLIFKMIKYRSMYENQDELLQEAGINLSKNEEWEEFQKIGDDPRITKIGIVLRKYSLDEWPQFLNVLRGEMSVVGPRPITPVQIELYGPKIENYYQVKPGITGFWQISGRNKLTFVERVLLDQEYLETQSLLGDIKIIFKTISVVIKAKGVS